MPAKIGILLFAGVLIIMLTGYLSYKSLSSVVTMIYKDNAPQNGLATIREISTNFESADNNIRLYGITKNYSYFKKYENLRSQIHASIDSLYKQYPGDEWFTAKIDTIQCLVDSKNEIWNEMVLIWRKDTIQNAISDLAREIKTVEYDTINIKSIADNASIDNIKKENKVRVDTVIIEKKGFFQRLFGKKEKEEEDIGIKPTETKPEILENAEPNLALKTNSQTILEPKADKNKKILEKLNKIEKNEIENVLKLQEKETELAANNNKINDALLSLMSQLEEYEKKNDLARYKKAGELADSTYKYLGFFILASTILSIMVLFLLIKYARKNREYNNALIKSRKETEELSKAKELFMANVSHEIRTPLNAIVGFIKQLLDMPLNKNIKEKMHVVNSASEQLLRLINDILDFSKLQAGKLSLQNTHFIAERVVENTSSLFSELARTKNNFIICRIYNEENLALYGDSNRFQQILSNLLSNAVKFTQEGTIEVVSLIQATESKDLATMTLTVKDTGLGIESSKLEKIFQDFTQEDQEIAVKYGGTGLGLSIVKKLVELFNGSVKVDSKKGVGTTVTCVLEFKIGDRDQIVSTVQKQTESAIPKGFKFLIADDEEYNRMLISTILNKWKVKYDMAKNGMEAIEFLQNKTYDIILMDLRMPEINGMMATKFIRETLKQSKSDVPVIGITADISNNIPDETKEFFNAFLIKPFTEEELLHIINKEIYNDTSLENLKVQIKTKEKEGNLDNLIRTAGNDLDFVEEMIEQFERSTIDGFKEMKFAIEQEKYVLVGDLAHKLAPASRHLELNKLLAQLKEIEAKAKAKDKVQIEKLYTEAKDSFSEAQKNLRKQLEQL